VGGRDWLGARAGAVKIGAAIFLMEIAASVFVLEPGVDRSE
jgi:hypothetical protein